MNRKSKNGNQPCLKHFSLGGFIKEAFFGWGLSIESLSRECIVLYSN